MGSHAPVIPIRPIVWDAAQVVAVVATIAVVAGLLLSPDVTLTIFWNAVIPLVPASLLVSPVIWRNVCPLATLNMTLNGAAGRRATSLRVGRLTGAAGIMLLALLVPARRFLFNEAALPLAAVIVAIAVVAVVAGAFFDAKAGFCNAFCPVLPVERLYGHRPLLKVEQPRCAPCTVCSVGCIDLDPEKTIAQTLGPKRTTRAWVATPFGIFAAAFPGFIVGYYLMPNVPLGEAGSVYLNVFSWSLASYVVIATLVSVLQLSAAAALVGAAALAVGLYYWFVGPVISEAFGVGAGLTLGIRIAALALVAIWLWRAVPRALANGWRTPVQVS